MAISLKAQLLQARQISSSDLDDLLLEAWVKSGGDDGGEYWTGDPQTGGLPFKKGTKYPAGKDPFKDIPDPSQIPSKNYYPPHINVLDKPSVNADALSKSTRLFYDFYALAALKDMVGTPRYPVKSQMSVMQQLSREHPGSNMFMVNYPETNIRMMGSEVPEKIRDRVDKAFEAVTIGITRKLLGHLRLTLIQEFRYLIGHARDWTSFRQHLVSIYNKNKGKITRKEFEDAIQAKIPGMVGHTDAVKRILLFCKYYQPMGAYDGEDPAKAVDDRPDKTAAPAEPQVGAPPEPSEPSEPEPEEPEEPDDTDYSAPQAEIPPGADYDTDDDKISNFMDKYGNEIEKAKLQQWFAAKKKKLTEGGYAGGRISPSTVRKVFDAVHKSGMTWQDVVLGYENLDWGAGIGAGLKLSDKHPGYGGARWGVGVEEFLKLVGAYKKGDTVRMAELVDHIYDLQHNSDNLLNKGGMFVADKDLDRRAVISSLPRFLPNVSPFVKRMILQVLPYTSKHADIEKDIDKFASSPTQPFTPEQEQQLTKIKFGKSPSGGNVWVTQAPFKNKKDETVQRHFILKNHANGMISLTDSMNAEGRVFDNFEEAYKFLEGRSHEFVMPQTGSSIYSVAADSEKENYINSHVKIKLDAAKETELLDKCKMGWRKSNSYYKAYMPTPYGERFQFFAFDDGTFLGCLKKKGGIEFIAQSWPEAFQRCQQITANALPNEEYAESKAWIGLPLGSPDPVVSPAPTQTPTVGGVPQGPKSLGPVEANILQILGQQKSGVSWQNNVMPEGYFAYQVPKNGMLFNVLLVGKNPLAGSGKQYKVIHAYGADQEEWDFPNFNYAYNFINHNFGALTQVTDSSVKGTIGTAASVTPQIFSTAPLAPLPPNATSQASYKVHKGIDKPPTHTIRLTVEDEKIMTDLGFVPEMVGTEPFYIHKLTKDTVKFFPNDTAKILFLKTNDKIVIEKPSIQEALWYLQSQFTSTGSVSPIEKPMPTSKGKKVGPMFEKSVADAGFVWDDANGIYNNTGNGDTIEVKPFPKSTLTFSDGQKKKFNSIPELVAFIKNYALGVKKK